MHVHYTRGWYLQWSEKVWIPWSWNHEERESPGDLWELNPGPMQEQQELALLVTTDPSLHFRYFFFKVSPCSLIQKNGALKEWHIARN